MTVRDFLVLEVGADMFGHDDAWNVSAFLTLGIDARHVRGYLDRHAPAFIRFVMRW
ncbi:hypothetical protein D3C75_1383150 [compost metagenome]